MSIICTNFYVSELLTSDTHIFRRQIVFLMDVELKETQEKEVEEKENGTESETSDSGSATPRTETPGTLPKYQYGRVSLPRFKTSK